MVNHQRKNRAVYRNMPIPGDEGAMKTTWFTHPEPMDSITADSLLSQYAARQVTAKKTLAFDPKFWTVSALLPESRHEPRPSKQFQNRIWS